MLGNRDGLHGVIADSLGMTWAQARALSPSGAPIDVSGIRVQSPDDRMSEARDWTIYEMIDRIQLNGDPGVSYRMLEPTLGTGLTFGRGRCLDNPYAPNLGSYNFPGVTRPDNTGLGISNRISRNRATGVRATTINLGAKLRAVQSGAGPQYTNILDNYRVIVCEGRTVRQIVSDWAFIFDDSTLDAPPSTIQEFLTPVPDYATRMLPQFPLSSQGGQYGVAWLTIYGGRFPGSTATAVVAPHVNENNPVWIPIPWWATMCHFFNTGAAPIIQGPVQISWELEL